MKHLPTRRPAAVAGALTAGLALMLAACTTSAPAESASAAPPAPAGTPDELYEQALESGVVTVYGPYQSIYAPVYEAFTTAYPGLRVETVDLSGAQLTSTLEAEFASGSISVDVLATGSIDVNQYAANGWIASGLPANAADLDPVFVGAGDTYLAPFGVTTVLAYNTNRISADDLPTTWADVLDPAYAGQIIVADPSMPGLATQALATAGKHGMIDDAYLEQLQSVAALAPNQAQALQQLATGQQSIELVASYDLVVSAMEDGAPVDFIVLDEGNPFVPTAYARISGSPNPAGAQLLQEWILTDTAQAELAEIANQGTAPDAPAPVGGIPPLSEVSVAVADLTADELAASLESLVAIFGAQ